MQRVNASNQTIGISYEPVYDITYYGEIVIIDEEIYDEEDEELDDIVGGEILPILECPGFEEMIH